MSQIGTSCGDNLGSGRAISATFFVDVSFGVPGFTSKSVTRPIKIRWSPALTKRYATQLKLAKDPSSTGIFCEFTSQSVKLNFLSVYSILI